MLYHSEAAPTFTFVAFAVSSAVVDFILEIIEMKKLMKILSAGFVLCVFQREDLVHWRASLQWGVESLRPGS